METFIESIRAAVASDASAETRLVGANACRAILAALEAAEGQPLASPPPLPAQSPQIATIVGALRGIPPDQLLELAIAKLRAALPAGTNVPAAQPVRFIMVPTPKVP